jgi:hypothetical protein
MQPVTVTVCSDPDPERWLPEVCGVVCGVASGVDCGVCALSVSAPAIIMERVVAVIDRVRIVPTPLANVLSVSDQFSLTSVIADWQRTPARCK